MKAKVILSEMTREQVRQAALETTVVLPTASIEQHGPHLPIQTDTCICEAVCRRAAERASSEVSVTVAPAVVFGNSHHHLPHPGVLSLTSGTFVLVVREVCESLVRSGFRRIAIVNGHGGNDEAIRLVARDLANAYPVTVAATAYWTVAARSLDDELASLGIKAFPGHAGHFETSLMLALRPDLVDGRPAAGAGIRASAEPLAATIARAGQRLGDGPGHSDDASLASAERGQRFLELIVRDLADFLVRYHRSQ